MLAGEESTLNQCPAERKRKSADGDFGQVRLGHRPISGVAPLGHYVYAQLWSSVLVGACGQSGLDNYISHLSDAVANT